jgi:hypothetical protein
VWDSGIPGVIGLGFAAANVTGEIRRSPEEETRRRCGEDPEIKNGYCPGSADAVPSWSNAGDFEEEWSERRERRNVTRGRRETGAIGMESGNEICM